MAASDNLAAAAASDLRRLTAHDEAFCRAAFAQLGKGAFKCLRRAVQRTDTPPTSGDEGGSGPAGASTTSTFIHHLDPADNIANALTVPEGANINNLILDTAQAEISISGPMFGAAPSPTTSLGTKNFARDHFVGEVPPLHQCDQYRPHGGRYHCGCIYLGSYCNGGRERYYIRSSAFATTAGYHCKRGYYIGGWRSASSLTRKGHPLRAPRSRHKGRPPNRCCPRPQAQPPRFAKWRGNLIFWRPTSARCPASKKGRRHRLAFQRWPHPWRNRPGPSCRRASTASLGVAAFALQKAGGPAWNELRPVLRPSSLQERSAMQGGNNGLPGRA